MNWDQVTKPKRYGGLGIREARQTNIALLSKIIWHLLVGDGGLWGAVLSHKYFGMHGACPFVPKNGASYLWQSLVKAWSIIKDGFR